MRQQIGDASRALAVLVPILDGQPRAEQGYADPDDGCITDGDDHVWTGNPEVLRGGGWKDFDTVGLGKRTREERSQDRMEDRSSSPAHSDPSYMALQYGDEDMIPEEEVRFFFIPFYHEPGT